MRIAGVLLAAGSSRRFGEASKLLADLHGRPLVDYAAAALEAASGLSHLAAVVRPDDESARAVLTARGFHLIENPLAKEGMGTSISAAAAWAETEGVDGLLIALGDAPFVRAELLTALADYISGLEEELAMSTIVAVSDDDGTPKSPAVFGSEHFGALRRLQGDQGARSVIVEAGAIVFLCFPGELDDIDTPEALEDARRRLAT